MGQATNVARRRLSSHRLTGEPFDSAVDAVRSLVAVQSQDYTGAKWGIGQRTSGLTDAALEQLFDTGEILRTHVMRPTWHFVLPDDIRWLLDLTAARVKMLLAQYDRRLEIDAEVLKRSRRAMATAVAGGSYLTRNELTAALERAGIAARGQRLGHLVMHAELDAVLASGPRRGRQHTYGLLDERAPQARRLHREEALVELTRRYFTGHGPAQAQDFAWWSGLTVADARRGLRLVGTELAHEVIAGKSYWSSAGGQLDAGPDPVVHLLPNFDELLVAYRDRSDSLDPAREFDTAPFPNGSILSHVVVLNGQVWGGWKRRVERRELVLELGPLDAMTQREIAVLEEAAGELSRFLEAPMRQVFV